MTRFCVILLIKIDIWQIVRDFSKTARQNECRNEMTRYLVIGKIIR